MYKLENAVNFRDPQNYCMKLINKTFVKNSFSPKVVVELGGSIGKNASELFPNSEYKNLDLVHRDEIPTVVCDATVEIPLESNSVDFIYTSDCFEHVSKPWVVAQELQRILKPGCPIFVSTLFSWRYHPVPEDYWRFTPSALQEIFDEIAVVEANFNGKWRRDNMTGFWKNKKDSVPIDNLGGFIENWKVYLFGLKVSA